MSLMLRISVSYVIHDRMAHKKPRATVKRDLSKAHVHAECVKALDLRLTGMSYRAIAEALGVSDHSTIAQRVAIALKAIVKEPAEAVLKMELERLDVLQHGLWEKAREGDLMALDRALKIQDRRARYLGLDAPTKVQEIPYSQLSDDELKAKWKELTGHDYVEPSDG